MAHPFKIILCIECVIILLFGLIWIGASGDNDRKCVEWETVIPTPVSSPLTETYTEWIPYPGTSPDSGHGWIKVSDFRRMQSIWPPRKMGVAILSDSEYNSIAKKHGLKLTQGGRIIYGFPPIQGFPRSAMMGVIIKNEWLPKRFQIK